MTFNHRLKNSDEEAFLFHFKHQNIGGAVNDFVAMWQERDLKMETSLENLKLNLIMLMTLLTRLFVKDGFPSEVIYKKTEFIITIIWQVDSVGALQLYERQVIDEYFKLFVLKHRKTENLIVNHILNHLYINLNRQVTLDEVAHVVGGVSRSHCIKVFKETMASTIGQYHTMLKMERADFFLTSTDMTLTEIALSLGYHDQSHFAKTFKRLHGVTPPLGYRTKHNL